MQPNSPITTTGDSLSNSASKDDSSKPRSYELFVGDLSFFCEERHLLELFKPFGTIVDVVICRSDSRGHSLLYGFVKVKNRLDADKAALSLDGIPFMGRTLRVQVGATVIGTTNVKRSARQGAHIHVSFSSTQPREINESRLRGIFEKYGCVLDVIIKRHTSSKSSGQSGYGFVYFDKLESAEHAVSQLAESVVDDVSLQCEFSHAKQSKSSDTPSHSSYSTMSNSLSSNGDNSLHRQQQFPLANKLQHPHSELYGSSNSLQPNHPSLFHMPMAPIPLNAMNHSIQSSSPPMNFIPCSSTVPMQQGPMYQRTADQMPMPPLVQSSVSGGWFMNAHPPVPLQPQMMPFAQPMDMSSGSLHWSGGPHPSCTNSQVLYVACPPMSPSYYSMVQQSMLPLDRVNFVSSLPSQSSAGSDPYGQQTSNSSSHSYH